jgi:hypothetical protein
MSRRLVFPHKQVGELAVVDVQAAHGVMAHRNFIASTACGREVSSTLVTRRDALVRCEACKAATPDAEG